MNTEDSTANSDGVDDANVVHASNSASENNSDGRSESVAERESHDLLEHVCLSPELTDSAVAVRAARAAVEAAAKRRTAQRMAARDGDGKRRWWQRRRAPARRRPASRSAWKRWLRRLLALTIGGLLLVIIAIAVTLWLHPVGPAQLDALIARSQATVVRDRQGGLLQIYVGPRDTVCFPVTRGDISPWLLQATIAVEDERFRVHPGVDPGAILRATVSNLHHRRVVSGASTLTMQLVKQIELPDRTWQVKLREAVQALAVERQLSKDEILTYYVNIVPYGGNLLGVEAASWRYFGKPGRDLSLAEAAMLAGIPQSPLRFRPDRYPQAALKRRNFVLFRMWQCGYITRAEYLAARAEPVAAEWRPFPCQAPHAAQLARDLAADAGVDRRDTGGRRGGFGAGSVRTTLDMAVQALAERNLTDQVDALASSGVTGGAIVVIDNASGEVRALVGSPDFFDDAHAGQVNGALALRSPGSTLKPFLYALALENGRLTPRRYVADTPVDFAGYRPANYDDHYHGPVSAQDALARSYNIPAVNLLRDLGHRRVLQYLRDCGLSTLTADADHYGLSLALGGGDVNLLDLTNAYAGLARLGEYRPVRLLADAPRSAPTRLCAPATAFMLAEMLADTDRLNGQPLWQTAEHAPRMAWKTGTSFGHRDAWAVAYTPQWTIGVWLGRPDGRPSDALIGQLAAAPVAARLLDDLSGARGSAWYTPPPDVEQRTVCALSGMVAGADCPHTTDDWARRGVSDPTPCTVHQRLSIDPADGRAVCAACITSGNASDSANTSAVSVSSPAPALPERVVEVWPPDLAAWLAEHGGADRLAPPHRASCPAIRPAETAPHIVTPGDGTTFVRLATPPGSMPQRVALQASATSDVLYWFVNGELLSRSQANQPAWWDLQPGRHVIACVDSAGRGSRVSIFVR